MNFENIEGSEKNCKNDSRAGDNSAPQGILKAPQKEDSDVTWLPYLRVFLGKRCQVEEDSLPEKSMSRKNYWELKLVRN